VLVISMIIVVSLQVLNFYDDSNYRKISDDARIAATNDRISLRNLVNVSNTRNMDVQHGLVNLLAQIYYLVNSTNSSSTSTLDALEKTIHNQEIGITAHQKIIDLLGDQNDSGTNITVNQTQQN
jgi:uncharacterized protein YfkK (UPF0435 family)